MILNRKKLLGCLAVLVCLAFLAACGNEAEPPASAPKISRDASFTFFNIGKNTRITGRVRGDLKKILGDAAVERRGVVNLTVNYNTFLEEHFPTLDRMNRQLNSDIGLRVKHPVTRLMYRYARQQGLPYDLVEVHFSEKSKQPILIRINFKSANPETLKTLMEKYGPSRKYTWGQEKGSSRVWQKGGDYLFYSVIPRRGNKVEYRIAIYFTAAVEALVQSETTGAASKANPKTGF